MRGFSRSVGGGRIRAEEVLWSVAEGYYILLPINCILAELISCVLGAAVSE